MVRRNFFLLSDFDHHLHIPGGEEGNLLLRKLLGVNEKLTYIGLTEEKNRDI